VALSVATVLLLGAVPVAAQEWRIHLVGRAEPIAVLSYVEESPWIFYTDDESMYIFAVGCNRVRKVERSGAEIPAPACPVERLPTTMPTVYIAIMDLEAKRLDDTVAKLREQTKAYADALFGSIVGARGTAATVSAAEAEAIIQRSRAAVAFLQSQINDSLFDIRLADQRVSVLLEAAKSFPPRERQRYFFATR